MQLRFQPIELPLRHVFRIARGATTVQKSVLVELRDGELAGYGEAATRSTTASRPPARLPTWKRPAALSKAGRRPIRPNCGSGRFRCSSNRFALAGLDAAAHDPLRQEAGPGDLKAWGLRLDHVPPSDYTLGIDSIENTLKILKEFEGWPIYKIKLGTPDDLQIVRQLRQHTAAVFRVDANCCWTAAETIAKSRELKALGVEFIEQPLPADDWEGMQRVFAESELPVVADESCRVEDDVHRCGGCFHGINIKLAKCGGMTPARRMIAAARRAGLKVMMGCMAESTVGISAIAQFLPLLDYVDMDGAMLLARDVATGVRLEKGHAIFPAENGNGVQLKGVGSRFS